MMSDRLEAAVRELVAALRDELRAETASEPPPDRLLDVREAATALGIGRSALYAELGRGEVRSVKVGRRRLVPSSALGAYIAERKTEVA